MSDSLDKSWVEEARRRQWRVRRRLAVASFVSVLAMMASILTGLFLGALDKDEVSALTGVAGGFMTWAGAIITAYIGFAAWHDVRSGGSGGGGQSP